MKRIHCRRVAGILIVTLSVLMPAGCSSSPLPAGSGQVKEGDSEDSLVQMEWLAGPAYSGLKEDAPILQTLEERYHIQLKTWDVESDEYWENVNARFDKGEMPDVIVLDEASQLAAYVDQGIIGELPLETIREKAPGYARAADAYDTGGFWQTMSYEGRNYGVANPMEDIPMVMVWRKDWLDKLGFKVPTTLADYEKVLTAFVKQDPDGNGKNDTSAMAERAFGAVFGAYGLRCVTGTSPGFLVEEMQLGEDQIPFFPYIRPGAQEALTLLHDWYSKGIIDKEFITGENHGDYPYLSHSFLNGKIGLTSAVPSEYLIAGPDTGDEKNWGASMKELKRLDPHAEIVFGPAPVGPDGAYGTNSTGKTGHLTCLTTKAAGDPRKVDAFLSMLDDYYEDMDYAKLVSYGQEGIHYENTGQGPVRLMEESRLKEEGVLLVDFGMTVPYAEAVTPQMAKFGRDTVRKSYPRFQAPATREVSDVIGQLKMMTDQVYYDIITGRKSVKYFDIYVEEFKTAGGDAAEKAVRQAYAQRLAAAR